MAKLTAHGAHEVARLRALPGGVGDTEVELVLRSDGVVLRKIVGLTGWGVMARFRKGAMPSLDADTLRRVAGHYGYFARIG